MGCQELGEVQGPPGLRHPCRLIYTLAAILIGTIFAFLLAGRVTRQIRLLLAGTDRMRSEPS